MADRVETIHHPGYDASVFSPYVPAIKVKGGNLLISVHTDDGDERVALREPLELRARLRGRVRVLGTVDDRGEDAVEVEEERRLRRCARDGFERHDS